MNEFLLETMDGKELDDPYDLFNRAIAYHSVGRFDDAIADYDHCLAIEPDYEGGMAWYNRGNVLTDADRPDEALASFRRAIEVGATEVGPFLNASIICSQQGRREEGLAFCDAYLALGLDPHVHGVDNDEMRLRRASFLFQLGRKDECARTQLEFLDTVEPPHPGIMRVGDRFLYGMRRPEEALKAFRLALPHIVEGQALVTGRMAVALGLQGKLDEAVALFRAAERQDPQTTKLLDIEPEMTTALRDALSRE